MMRLFIALAISIALAACANRVESGDMSSGTASALAHHFPTPSYP